MDADFKQRWIAALRSGEYEQGTRTLRSKRNRFCCLGVACDLIEPKDWKIKPGQQFYYWHGMRGALPVLAANAIGLDQNSERTLVELNDMGSPFTKIADWIEENL